MRLKELLLIVSIIYIEVAISSNLTKDEMKYLNSVFKHIPPDQRKYVLLHQLYIGYSQHHPNVTPKAWDISKDDTKKIYELFLKKLKIPEVDGWYKGQICFPDNTCIDTDDSGIYPG